MSRHQQPPPLAKERDAAIPDDSHLGGLAAVAAKGSAYSVLAAAVAAVASFGTNILLGRQSSTVLGTYTLLTTVASFLVTFLFFGGTNVVVHFTSGREAGRQRTFVTAYGLLVFTLMGAGLAVVALAPGSLTALFGGSVAELSLPALSIVAAAMTAATLCTAFMQGHLRLSRAALVQMALPVCTLVAAASIMVSGDTSAMRLQLAVAAAAVGAAAVTAAISRFQPRLVSVAETGRMLDRQFWLYATPFHLSTVALFLASNFDMIVAARDLGVAGLGVYKVAALGRQLARWGPTMLSAPLYPVLRRCEVEGWRGQAVRLADGYVRLMTAVSIAAAGILLGGAGVFVRLFGSGYEASLVPYMVLVAASAAFFPVTAVTGAGIVARGYIWQSLVMNVGLAAAGWLAGGVAAQRWGLVGLASVASGLVILNALAGYLLLSKAGMRLPLGSPLRGAAGIGCLVAARAFLPATTVIDVAVVIAGLLLPFVTGVVRPGDIAGYAARIGVKRRG